MKQSSYILTRLIVMVLLTLSGCLRTGVEGEMMIGGSSGAGGVEGMEGAARCEVGLGLCKVSGFFVMSLGGERSCDVTPLSPQIERCNEPGSLAEDEDCDGRINEGLDLTQCPVCTDDVTPSAERCDGVDNDCDGVIDERLETPGRLFRGVCAVQEAKITCVKGRYVDPDYTLIADYEGPEELSCDGLDNDCDGEVDEGVFDRCASCVEVRAERCDGVDNDCDGVVDESDCT